MPKIINENKYTVPHNAIIYSLLQWSLSTFLSCRSSLSETAASLALSSVRFVWCRTYAGWISVDFAFAVSSTDPNLFAPGLCSYQIQGKRL